MMLLMAIQVLHSAADTININVRVWNLYFRNLLPGLVKKGDDGNYGSTATCDTLCLQVRTYFFQIVPVYDVTVSILLLSRV